MDIREVNKQIDSLNDTLLSVLKSVEVKSLNNLKGKSAMTAALERMEGQNN